MHNVLYAWLLMRVPQVDIRELATSTGQRPSTPKPVVQDTSDTEGDHGGDGDDEAEARSAAANGAGPSKPPVKRRKKKDWYDLEDNFIDDSELHLDERTTFAQTKQKGFYVSQGEVALLREKYAFLLDFLSLGFLLSCAGHRERHRRCTSYRF
jgi:hypothetical protein